MGHYSDLVMSAEQQKFKSGLWATSTPSRPASVIKGQPSPHQRQFQNLAYTRLTLIPHAPSLYQ